LRTRGFRNRADAHSWQTIGRVAGSLLVRGTDRAERVAAAMRCRGFDGTYRTLADFRTRPTDVLALAAAAGLAAGLLALDCWPTGGA
jgi:cobalt/nickel transport system permease protein